MEDYVIAEEYTLPSKGMVYDQKVNPDIKIRSMTTEEEMKRLSKTDSPYKMLSEIIDDCLVVKPGINTYDMCVADYQFLLHKLRTVTYGADYKVNNICPICGSLNEDVINLEDLKVSQYSDELDKYMHITLPMTKKLIDLRMQTPRMLDDINRKAKELSSKSPNMKSDPAFLFSLKSMIDKVDGEKMDDVKLEQFLRHLPMKDTNYIIRSMQKLNLSLGVDTIVTNTCKSCGGEYTTTFPITDEFFGPSID